MAASIWKGSISFGLLNIPVSLQSAQMDKDVHFSLLDKKDMSRIRYQKISAKTGEEVPSDRIVKAYQYEPGRFVMVTEADLKKANVKATQTIDIEDFVLLEDVDPLLFDRPYYLVPQKGAEKGYYLLRDALAETQKVAIGKIVIRVKQHLAMIMARRGHLVLELLRFAHQVKSEKQVQLMTASAKKTPYTQKELKMAEDLIDGMTSDWKPEQYKDTYYNDIMKAIQNKVKQGKGYRVAEPKKEEKIVPTDNVIDLMPLLKKSLETHRPRTAKKKVSSRPSRRAGA
ncbi:Ku protein [Bdellovibrio sp. HCB2-146]|uniref:non-homologous end joining protein Ku n=1 Tax=Bdellovibrio sp. HCB2-146 TaxID=3394362 RepID=UPI0039BCDD48